MEATAPTPIQMNPQAAMNPAYAPPAYGPPAQAYAPPPQAAPSTQQQQIVVSPTIVTAPQPVMAPTVQIVQQREAPVGPGICRSCRIGKIKKNFTTRGWLWCLCCFPIGIICCLLMREKRCRSCGLRY